ncbi:thiamine phosphate synthase [Roseomonas elaeocarpi]|uniref:Thiamine phosphate synthase n=1 Tax=Roseomonas elaeocarpi TaxID=907779 RepID=A0ABV6JX39_9PROT
MTDARRLPDPLAAARCLPPGAAVLARDLAPDVLFGLARLCRQRRLQLMVSGDGRLALRHRAGLHLPDRRQVRGLLPFLRLWRGGRGGLLSAAAHGRRGLGRGRRLRVDALLLSPVFPTRSHPGEGALGLLRWCALARDAAGAVIALGGMNAAGTRRLPRWVHGVAALEALLPPRHSVSRMSREIVTGHCSGRTG